MPLSLLTPLQERFLQLFFGTRTGQAFFLTGGTALAAFYFQHRKSVDLDLFTVADQALDDAERLVPQLAGQLGCTILQARRTEFFAQYFLDPGNDPPLRVDLVHDFGPQFGEHRNVGGIVVDSLENIAVNKITAIFNRTEIKDFVDLYFILHEGYTLDDLFTKAQQKDTGLQPFYFAGALLQVQRLQHLPDMLKPVSLEKVRDFFIALGNRLLDEINPERRTPDAE